MYKEQEAVMNIPDLACNMVMKRYSSGVLSVRIRSYRSWVWFFRYAPPFYKLIFIMLLCIFLLNFKKVLFGSYLHAICHSKWFKGFNRGFCLPILENPFFFRTKAMGLRMGYQNACIERLVPCKTTLPAAAAAAAAGAIIECKALQDPFIK